MAPPLFLHVPDVWESALPASVASLLRIAPPPAGELEVEARAGRVDEGTGAFVPGVSRAVFEGMVLHLKGARKHPFTESTTIDVVFSDDARPRITVDESGTRVLAIVKKTLCEQPVDFKVTSDPGKHVFDLRLTAASERPGAAVHNGVDLRALATQAAATPRAALLPPVQRIRTGCALKIKPGAPISSVCSFTDLGPAPVVLPGVVDALQWTILRPNTLQALQNDGHVTILRAELDFSGDAVVRVINLPGRLPIRTERAELMPVGEGEFCVDVPFKFLEPIGEAHGGGVEGVSLLRKKHRVSFALAKDLVLDMTRTYTGANVVEMYGAPPVHEIEVERVLRAGAAMDAMDAMATEMVAWICRRMYGVDVGAQAAVKQRGDGPPAKRAKATSDQAETAAFYEQQNRSDEAMVARGESLVFHMRAFNNFVKSAAIQWCVQRARAEPLRFLDIACGKGADLRKVVESCRDLGVRFAAYAGLDITRGSLDEAIERLSKMQRDSVLAPLLKDASAFRLVEADLGAVDFSVGSTDAARAPTYAMRAWSSLPPATCLDPAVQYNVASMQFALHYMFTSERACARFFKSVASRLAPGGLFVASLLDADAVVARLLQTPAGRAVEVKDDKARTLCVMDFDAATVERLVRPAAGDDGFGLRYRFNLFDDENEHAINAPEWLVPAPLLARMAGEAGLAVERRVGFREFALETLEQSPPWRKLYSETVFVPNCKNSMTDFEWDLVGLYQVVIMRKLAVRPAEEDDDDLAARFVETTALLAARMGETWHRLSSEEQTAKVQRIMDGYES